MKAKSIFRGAVAGFMSLSLLLSGMPVMATDANHTDSGQQVKEETAEPSAQNNSNQPAEGEGGTPDAKTVDSQQQEKADGQSDVDKKDAQAEEKAESGEETGADKKDAQTEEKADSKEDADAGKDKDKKSAGDKKDAKDKEDAGDKKEDAKENAENEPQALSAGFKIISGSIDIDGNLSDWKNVSSRAANVSNVDSWKIAYSSDGNTVYLSFSGTASTEWDYNFSGNRFTLAYADGAQGADSGISVAAHNGGASVKNGWYGDVSGASAAVTNEAHGNNAGPYTVEIAVPISFFHSPDFTVTFGGTSVKAVDIEQLDGQSVAEEVQPVYTGISIDGDYADWAAVAMSDASCPNSQHPGCLSRVAAVYDGDWFYIYIKDGEGSNASGAGSHSNGKFAIVSDLGYETDIQLSTAPEVRGVNGAKVAYVGSEWEIAIPKDQLPKYEERLSFNLYLGDALVSDIVNLQPDSGNNLENLFSGVVFDGSYEDWEDYGHETIQYATPGSQESQIDAKGALYSADGKLYGHVVTNMPQHLQEAGQEYTEAITIAFNQSQEKLNSGTYDKKMAFYPRFVTVDASGNINWNPKPSGLPEGTYEYYIASLDAWHTSTNINNLNEMDLLYGKMMMTIAKDGKDEMEFYLDLPMVAKKLGVGETDLKQIAAQFGRIGQQWIYTAGTSTGPVVGVILCVAAVGVVFWYRKRRYGEFLPVSA